ncbi:helix-turn-helix domain-containing protein [Kibdelosporangium philippinense]|uniref:Helix-turn-helix domain-containing protein n=1 Tax=Kibdelosporangium philippinense TaxID=211113 RepID=A0ABS8ZH08_9PSEU|nr:helix-turn-helix transcriptional regulator [Kibdelosporangium philippinense]MCE7006842.1 helix-turn-helix domain-containing protein [Kibdelosporangium philippinense]
MEPVEVLPVVVVSKTFPARPSSIPEIQEFVRASLTDSPLTEAGNRELTQTVFRALLAAAGPVGTIQICFRIFPEHVEIDVLHSHSGIPADPRTDGQNPAQTNTFAEWMTEVLRSEGLTPQDVAKQLGVSVRTVSRWVGGETEPRMRDLRRLQERFGDLPLA